MTFFLCQCEVGNNTLDDDPILRAEEYFYASVLVRAVLRGVLFSGCPVHPILGHFFKSLTNFAVDILFSQG